MLKSEIQINNKNYRYTTATKELKGNRYTQSITVEGVGSKHDPAIYGSGGHRTESMESTARLIALEIIREME
ncbi:hypothetical protein [Trabulsiella odontotermitis]|jgi:hypothetical protein|uniref:hypothetical protein n=1 Tax=Trabulsiella odontotermitis TaxID=379893 RepID=UPI000F60EB95|nr:hypothetical protein [Trabulsiella odontotermitis]